MRTGQRWIFLIAGIFFSICSMAQQPSQRPLTTYSIVTTPTATCTSIISLTLFQERTGNDSLNRLLIDEFLGNFMQSKPLQKLEFFYDQRKFGRDSSFDFNITTSLEYSKNDLYSFTSCPKYACDNEKTSTYETQMATLDIRTGKFLTLNDVFESSKMDSLEKLIYKFVTAYHLRSLPTCATLRYEPNQIQWSNGATVATDQITYFKGLTHKFFFSEGRIHLYNKVKHTTYDYDDVEIAMPLTKLIYFLKPEMRKRLELE